MTAIDELYVPRIARARAMIASAPILSKLLAQDIDANVLERFLIEYCSLGVQITEPVEGWIARSGQRCSELGLANIRFARGDILELGALAERFHLIECSGVLHHMRDPMAGWRVLLALLEPGGFMKLGLYSELARRHIVAAREKVAGMPVRAARQHLLALPAADPARKVTTLRDFYSASGARDLVLHVQEHRFTIPQLASMMSALQVEFLGFELPGRRTTMSLEEWDEYETANPDTFASMYQFWVRKP